MVDIKSLKAALRETVKSTSPTQHLSDAQYSDGFNIIRESGQSKYQDFILPQLSMLFTSLLTTRTRISVLEIGPGPASVLGHLPDHVRRYVTRYAAFEPNVLFAERLDDSLDTAVLPLLDGPPTIHRLPFTPDSKLHKNDFDMVLFCHSMYGMNPKEDYLEHALRLTSEDGVVAIFHRDGVLHLDGLQYDQAVSFPTGITIVADDDGTLDRFASFVAGFELQDPKEYAAVQAEWRQVCRALGRREKDRPDLVIFDSPEIMVTLTQRAAAISELEALVPSARPNRKVKNWEARLHSPACIVRPSKVEEVQQCVWWALEHGVGLTVIGGGHSGHCVWPGVTAIDMTAFDQIHIITACDEYEAAKGALVVVEAGCKSGDIINKTLAAGLTVPLGARPSVGAGLWLQGGIGHLARLHGLACDNIIGAVLVCVASGKIVCVGCVPAQHRPSDAVRPDNEMEILWELKGAGTNFGIVVSVTFTAHVAPVYCIRDWVYPLRHTSEVVDKLKDLATVARDLPRNCSTDAYLWSDGPKTMLGVTMFEASAKSLISDEPLQSPTLVHETLGAEHEIKTVDSTGLFEADMYMSGMHGGHGGGKTSSFKRCLFFQRLEDPMLLQKLVDAFNDRPSPLCYFHLLHGGGAVQDVAEEDSAFGCRKWDFACVVTGIWPREQDGTNTARATVQWVYDVVKDLECVTLGVYGADLGPDLRDAALASKAFGPNVRRLVGLKRKMDPSNVLAYACPLLES